jgi:hypothetical protein
MRILHDALIAGHALGGVIAFALGTAVAARRGNHPAQALVYAASLTVMAVFLTAAVVLDWHGLSLAVQSLYAALVVLAGYTVWRGWRARNELAAARPSLPRALDDVGFTLITLFTGFVVVLVGDLGGPAWLVVLLGILAVATGRRLAGLAKARRLS